MPSAASFFTPASLRFLRGLARHNRREWFEAHRRDYETAILFPMRDFVEEMDVRLARLAPEMVGDPKRSIFRIYRDVRFSKDKSPYKTHAACWFYHRDASHKVGEEAHGGGAGFYFHVQPGASLDAGGMWMPARVPLDKIRDALAAKPAAFERIVAAPALRRRFRELDTDAILTRVPRGYAPDHPAARWLRYRTFTVSRPLSDAQITSARLPALLADDVAVMLPLVRWINAALGLKPAPRR
ncbi:MAG TPA: DUF2461 domain-containing protein [Gemmatimonadales bacterium]|nr:DUF2461 domain-containing protein [Gemmatimonadales bacterium]